MASEVQSQSASGTSYHIILSLCLITTCLLNMTTLPPAMEQGGHIILWFNLAIGYLLAMASLFSTDAEIKVAAAKLSVVSAWVSMVLTVIVMGEPKEANVQVQRLGSAGG